MQKADILGEYLRIIQETTDPYARIEGDSVVFLEPDEAGNPEVVSHDIDYCENMLYDIYGLGE